MKKNYAYLFLSALIPLFVGCSSSKYIEANRFYNNLGFAKAIPLYEKALEKKNIPDAKIKLADAYRKINNSVKAEYWYSQVVNMPQCKPENKLFYAEELIKNGKYNEAEKWLVLYEKENPSDKRTAVIKNSSFLFETFYSDSSLYRVELLKLDNSLISDFCPVYYKSGIVFTSEKNNTGADNYSLWTNRPFLDLFFLETSNPSKFSSPELLKGKINSKYNDGPVTFNKEGTEAYFTRNNFENRKAKKNIDGIVNLKIYKASLVGDEWTNIESMPFNSDIFSNGHATLSSDGLTMYFVSDRPNGVGGTDLYFSSFKENKWTQPVSLGNVLNTPGDEMFPYLHNDTILYFASDGFAGLGGLDIFYSIKKNNQWTEPVNMGYPINSCRDDFGYISDAEGNTGYFSSSRMGNGDIDNIFSFTRKDRRIILNGLVVEKNTQEPIGEAKIELAIKENKSIEFLNSDFLGIFKYEMLNSQTYKISVSKEGFLTQTKEITAINSSGENTLEIKFELEKIEINIPIVLENIYYDFDQWNIRDDAARELDKLAEIMSSNPNIKIELSSHADSRGTVDYNQQLTQKRAEAAVDYLVTKNVSSERMIAKGYGESKLLNNCVDGVACIETLHQQNRRTEFKIIHIENIVQNR